MQKIQPKPSAKIMENLRTKMCNFHDIMLSTSRKNNIFSSKLTNFV